jgi:hypothetical protein
MGMYVDPLEGTKDAFLEERGKEITLNEAMAFDDFSGPALPVCLVDNGPFKAAGVMYNYRELTAFTDPFDGRPRRYFIVMKDDLKNVTPPSYAEHLV